MSVFLIVPDGVQGEPREVDPGDAVFPGFVVRRGFTFEGRDLQTGDPISVSIRNHVRFVTLVSAGHIGVVRSDG